MKTGRSEKVKPLVRVWSLPPILSSRRAVSTIPDSPVPMRVMTSTELIAMARAARISKDRDTK